MGNINFIIREDSENRVIFSDNHNQIDIIQLLENEYYYLFKSLNEDKFSLRIHYCDIFKELLYKNKVVGFVTYNVTSEYQYTLTNIYILTGFRRSRLFYNELKYQLTQDIRITILEPSRQVVEALIKYNWAKKITKNLVVSAVNFSIDLSKAISNKENTNKSFILTNIYDLNICATVSLKIFNQYNYEVYYTPLFEEDKRFNCEEIRENMDEIYFDKFVTELIERDSEIERWLFILNKNIPSKPINTEDIIGKPTQFSQILQNKINEKILTEKEAKFIQNQLFVELKTGKVEKESLELRLEYLIDNYHEKIIRDNTTENYCPYCFEDVDYLENYCINCGYTLYNFSDIDEEEFVYKHLLEEKQSYKFSLTGKKELKNYFHVEYLIEAAMGLIIHNLSEGLYGEDIFDVVSTKYNIQNVDLENIMIDRGYITYDMNAEKWEKEAYDFKNVELKEILKEHNCKISGNKIELIQRITKEVPLNDIESNIPSLTEKGMNHLSEISNLLLYDRILNDFIYEDFKEFMDENNNKEYEYGLVIEFLEKHVEYAKKTKNHDQLVDSLRIEEKLFSNADLFEEVLETELNIFIINLNMIYIDSHYYPYYKPVEKHSWLRLNDFKNLFTNEEFSNKFSEVFQSFDEEDLKVSFYDTVDYLQDVLKQFNLSAINRKINNKYYKRRDYKIKNFNRSDKNYNSFVTTLDRFFS